MHYLNKLDEILDRKAIAEASGIHYIYLCSLIKKTQITPEVEYRLKKGVAKLLRKLKKLS